MADRIDHIIRPLSLPIIRPLSLPKKLLLFAVALALAIAAAPALLAQQQPGFEVATVKPNHTGGGVSSSFNGVTISLTNLSLKRMIVFAYQIRDFQVTGGPNWLDSDHFDIEAKTTPDATIDQKLMMVRTLLKERFQLAFHRETRELPIYNLTIAKGGLKIQPLKQNECIPHDPKPPDSCRGGRVGPTMIRSGSSTLPDVATMLSVVLDRVVVDETKVAGQFRFQLNFAPEDNSAAQQADAAGSDAPSIFTAVQEQLGLRLNSAKGPVEVLVVDHAERPSEN